MHNSRNLHPTRLGLLVCLLIGMSLVVAMVAGGTAQANFTPPTLPALAGPGTPAIQLTRTGIPGFTVTDVQHYLAAHPFGRTTSGQQPKVLEIAFMPKEQASAIMRGEPITMLPAHALVCYVQFQGPFLVDSGYGPIGAKPATFQIGEEVFDARTGNLLGGGYR